MDITPLAPEGRQIIQGYGEGRFRITGVAYEHPVIVFPEHTLPWDVGSVDDMTLDNLGAVFAHQPQVDILLIGCGRRMMPVPPSLRVEMRERGVTADSMDTGAACRTFNVLTLEDRRVAAALIPV